MFLEIIAIIFLEFHINSSYAYITFLISISSTTINRSGGNELSSIPVKDYGKIMMAPLTGNIFRATGAFCGKFTGQRWIPPTKASDAELFLICGWTNGWVNNRDADDLRRNQQSDGIDSGIVIMQL